MDHEKLAFAVNIIVEGFKTDIIRLINTSPSQKEIIQFINEYIPPTIDESTIMKKKRIKNPIPFHEKCIARRANGEQCSRRKKTDGSFCGTHNKACPHGTVGIDDIECNDHPNGIVKKQIEVWLEDISGIMYWINDTGTVYHPDDIKENIENPRIIAYYEKNEINGKCIYNITSEIHTAALAE